MSHREVIGENFNIFRRDRVDSATTKHKGSGVMTAVHKSVCGILKEKWMTFSEDFWVTITSDKHSL